MNEKKASIDVSRRMSSVVSRESFKITKLMAAFATKLSDADECRLIAARREALEEAFLEGFRAGSDVAGMAIQDYFAADK